MADKLRAKMLQYKCQSVMDFIDKLMDCHTALQASIREAKEVGLSYSEGANYSFLNSKGQS